MKKILHYLGAGAWQVPSIQAAKKMGYQVLVTDMYEERVGYSLADFHEMVDISDLTGTLKVAEKYKIDGIICDTTDVGVPTAAFVAEKLSLPGIGYETALKFTNKILMRQSSNTAGVLNPKFRQVSNHSELRDASQEIRFPLIVKPIDCQSSRGVYRVDTFEQLEGRFQLALTFSKAKTAIIEEFISGTEVTVEGVCINGNYHTLAISDKFHFTHRPQVAKRLTYPPDFKDRIKAQIKQANECVVHSLGLKNGVTHAEYLVNQNGVYLVEIAARGGGTRVYSHIVPYVSGVSVPQAYLEFATTGSFPKLDFTKRSERAANLEFFSFEPGVVRSITGLEEAKSISGVEEIWMELQPGDTVHLAEDDRSRVGHVLVFGETRDEVILKSERVKDLVKVDIVQGE